METNTEDCKIIIQRVIGYIIEKQEIGQGETNRNTERNQIEWYMVYGGTHSPSNNEAIKELSEIRQEGAKGQQKGREDRQQSSGKERKASSQDSDSKQRQIEELERKLKELKGGR